MKIKKEKISTKSKVQPKGRQALSNSTLAENLKCQERLARELRIAIANSGLKISEFCKKYGIPAHVGTAIARNARWFGHSDRRLIRKIATAINQPPLWIYLWTNVLSVDDFIFEESLEDVLESAYLTMCATMRGGAFMIPSQEAWDKSPTEVKTSLVLLYQEAFKEKLLKLATVPVPGK